MRVAVGVPEHRNSNSGTAERDYAFPTSGLWRAPCGAPRARLGAHELCTKHRDLVVSSVLKRGTALGGVDCTRWLTSVDATQTDIARLGLRILRRVRALDARSCL